MPVLVVVIAAVVGADMIDPEPVGDVGRGCFEALSDEDADGVHAACLQVFDVKAVKGHVVAVDKDRPGS